MASVFNVTAVALVPIDVIGLGVEYGGDMRLDGDEALVVRLLEVIDDGRDVGLTLTGEDVFRLLAIIERVATVLDVDVDDVLTHRLKKLPSILPWWGELALRALGRWRACNSFGRPLELRD